MTGALSVCKTLHKCELCGSEFYPKRTDRTRFCGRKCGLEWSSFKRAVQQNNGRVYVRRAMRTHPPAHKRAPAYTPVTEAVCKNCGATFDRRTPGASRFMCSEHCRASAFAAVKRRFRKARKAKERGAITTDRIDPMKVFERDGWRCGICGSKTIKGKRGTYHPRAPELDHIVAIAIGGQHTWANVQCACRLCNIKKGAASVGQLNLFPAG